MRCFPIFVYVSAVFAGAWSCTAAPASSQQGCLEIARPAPHDGAVANANALRLFASVTQMLSPLGKPVMASNFGTTLAINNQAITSQQAQALVDALITNENAHILADGLGDKMAGLYRDKAVFWSTDDGVHTHCGQIDQTVTALIAAANATSASDSGAGKLDYAGAGQLGAFILPPGGVFDVIGKAYGHEAGPKDTDPKGNARPFQTAPLDATSGPRIVTYEGTDFFRVATHSGIDLTGPTKADLAAGRTGSNLVKSPSFPSGHTTFGYTESLILAMMVPERYRALAYRGSEYGNSRIVIGAHYAIDVIAGRTLATYDLAQDLAGTPGYARVPGLSFRAALAGAARVARAYIQTNGCPSIAECAARDPIARAEDASVMDRGTLTSATPRDAFAFRLTYGLTPMGPETLPPEPVPAAAATLLETRFPYLTPNQRLDILRSTEGPSGHFLDASPLDGSPLAAGPSGPGAEVGAYSRLDLYAAAGGYGSFADQVTVTEDVASITDPDLAPFLDLARADTWSNDIGGPGGLTKRGSGTLTLSGTNTFTGPTNVEGGRLNVTGSMASAIRVGAGASLSGEGMVGEVVVAPGGILVTGAEGSTRALAIDGSLNLQGGATCLLSALSVDGASRIAGRADLDGAHLRVRAGAALRSGVRYTVLTAAGGVRGTFADVAFDPFALNPKLTYAPDAVYLTFEEKAAEGPRPN